MRCQPTIEVYIYKCPARSPPGHPPSLHFSHLGDLAVRVLGTYVTSCYIAIYIYMTRICNVGGGVRPTPTACDASPGLPERRSSLRAARSPAGLPNDPSAPPQCRRAVLGQSAWARSGGRAFSEEGEVSENAQPLGWYMLAHQRGHTHTHTHIYIYILASCWVAIAGFAWGC